ncbi:MAG: hypothetical protein ACOY30_06560 [Bacillota bacterium]
MYPYMVEKNKWGTYGKSMEYSVGIFASKDPLEVERNAVRHTIQAVQYFLLKASDFN